MIPKLCVRIKFERFLFHHYSIGNNNNSFSTFPLHVKSVQFGLFIKSQEIGVLLSILLLQACIKLSSSSQLTLNVVFPTVKSFNQNFPTCSSWNIREHFEALNKYFTLGHFPSVWQHCFCKLPVFPLCFRFLFAFS